ncbi:hypothetical protein [Aquincola agrisoli]
MQAADTDDFAALVEANWPAVAGRLGERRAAFLDTAVQQAARHGLVAPLEAARYLNLCFAFGPAFETRPQHEWALALLADERLAPAVKLHQLKYRAVPELQRQGGDAAALQRADAALADRADAARRAADPDAEPLPRQACDIEAIDLRVLEADWRHEYRAVEGQWQRVPGPPPPAALRIDGAHPAPAVLSVLTHAPGRGPQARLQVRQALHGGCGERHPAVRWLGAEGLARWHGHEARAVSWPVAAMAPQPPATGLGLALAEEIPPGVALLETPTCALRDEGLPLGPLRTQVWTYPADQWLFALQREAGPEWTWSTAAAPAAGATPATRCRIERDGFALDARGWIEGFDQGLAQALRQGFGGLFEQWSQRAQNAGMQARPALLTGRAALAWGWREGAGGLAGEALMRVAGELDLGCGLAVSLDGEFDLGGSRARVQLSAEGDVRLQRSVLREQAKPGLLDAVLPCRAAFRLPFSMAVDPIAHDDGLVWAEAGPCSGAIVGEAGLRPRLSGGSGWQWFVRASVEPVVAPVMLADPLLGQVRRHLALLPALPLLDWSLG